VTKILDTYTLRLLNRAAVKAKKNRSLKSEFFEAIDPEGVHVTMFEMLHNEFDVRLGILAKMRDTMTPVEVWLDVDLEVYHKLAELPKQ